MAKHRAVSLFIVWFLAAMAGAHAQDAAALIAQGDSLLEADRGTKAMEVYDAAIALAPTADTYAGRARGWYYLGKYDKFITDVASALKLDSLHANANYQRALYAFRSGNNSETIGFASRVQPKGTRELWGRALVLRGEAEAALGMNAQAITDLAEGLDERLDDLPAMKTLARLYDAAGQPSKSLVVLERLCAAEPGDIGNWSNRGFELSKLERYEEAVQVLDRALDFDKDEPVVLSNKAHALLKLDRDAEALSAVNRSLKAEAANPYALRTRALLYLRKGDQDKACDDLTLSKAMGGAPEVDGLIKQHCSGMPKKR
ncbi:MAG: hypothetical protein IPO60_00990 [Flavobacteriales bacterium]|jgi:tetratricopeptide (TPR) repeat protein|nr:hypothetical protein [Flavobacteriales bacterium]MBK6891624.1 hypothetical protein [Flavobacteriales bacterium]MBK7247550.1 hypothetical protein [Flavobacteriales bacterium]MBK7286490.1 hypothetical protein [Flavobacteriales bacterium]MBK9596917.1 hypothetical protein [Flavobacteriales bacterium]